jgi:endonuclease YncB( thermonuclease family)
MGQTCKDARGRDYDCFERSKQALSRLIGRNQVECHMRGKAIGRQIGTCAVNGLDLAAMMVRDGWAMAYHGLSHQYVDLEGIAQARKRGIWSGHAEAPWLWRTARNNRNK